MKSDAGWRNIPKNNHRIASHRMCDQICLTAVEALLDHRTDEVRLVMAHLVQDIIRSALVLLP